MPATPPSRSYHNNELKIGKLRVNHLRVLRQRLLTGTCEVCGGTDGITVHHVRRLADLEPPEHADAPRWAKLMSTKRRKTLIVCDRCHGNIHQRGSTS
jgi:AI2M/AI1M-like HNH endonuclease